MSDVISGGNGENGKVSVRGRDGVPLAELLAFDNEAAIGAGNQDRPGRLSLFNGAGLNTVSLTTADATLILGSNGVSGTVSVRGADGQPLAELLGRDNEAAIGAGNQNRPGRFSLFNGAALNTVNLTAADATLTLGGNSVNGTVSVRGADGQPLVELLGRDNECVIGLGQAGRPGRISVFGTDRQEKLRLDAATGVATVQILEITGGTDLAEYFAVQSDADIEPGTVMVIDDCDPGKLKISSAPYDRKVAGVVSGAGGIKAGMVLQNSRAACPAIPVALTGRVYCKADASSDEIDIGDLLTTSSTPGHAMKAADDGAARGAILGKALTRLRAGTGLILLLGSLQ
jgi:hypothetical protein